MNKIELLIYNEQLYLGSILLEPELLDESKLQPNDFYNTQHKMIFKAMQQLKEDNEQVTLITLAELGESFLANIGGISYLQQLAESVPSTAAFEKYEQNIRSFHTVQRGVNIVQEFLDSVKETHNLKHLQQLIQRIGNLEIETVKKRMNFQEMVVNRILQHETTPAKGFTGMDTGFANLNKVIDGWQNELIILGARPSMGKTAWCLNAIIKTFLTRKKVKIIFFSLEMAEEQIIDRMIAILGDLNLSHVRNPNKYFDEEMWERHRSATGVIGGFNFEICNEATVPAQRAVIRKSMKENPETEHIVFIDYLTLMRSTEDRSTKNDEVEKIVIDLKQMVLDFKIPVIVLAQLSRAVEMRNDKRPILSDLRDSGSIEQAGDLVMFLYRDEKYNPDTHLKGHAELIIAKNRNGPTGVLWFQFEHKSNKFIPINNRGVEI